MHRRGLLREVVGLFLAAIGASQFVLASRAVDWLDRASLAVSLGAPGLVLVSLAVAVGFVPGDRRKAHVMDLITALWIG